MIALWKKVLDLTVTRKFAAAVGCQMDINALLATRVLTADGTPTSLATAGAETYTAAQLLTGIIVRDPTGAGRTDTLATAALLVAELKRVLGFLPPVGSVLTVHVVNGADAAEAITLAAGAGGAFDANQTATARVINQFMSKDVKIRITNATPGAEAYVIYA